MGTSTAVFTVAVLLCNIAICGVLLGELRSTSHSSSKLTNSVESLSSSGEFQGFKERYEVFPLVIDSVKSVTDLFSGNAGNLANRVMRKDYGKLGKSVGKLADAVKESIRGYVSQDRDYYEDGGRYVVVLDKMESVAEELVGKSVEIDGNISEAEVIGGKADKGFDYRFSSGCSREKIDAFVACNGIEMSSCASDERCVIASPCAFPRGSMRLFKFNENDKESSCAFDPSFPDNERPMCVPRSDLACDIDVSTSREKFEKCPKMSISFSSESNGCPRLSVVHGDGNAIVKSQYGPSMTPTPMPMPSPSSKGGGSGGSSGSIPIYLDGARSVYSFADLISSIAKRVAAIGQIEVTGAEPTDSDPKYGLALDVADIAINFAINQVNIKDWKRLARSCTELSDSLTSVNWANDYWFYYSSNYGPEWYTSRWNINYGFQSGLYYAHKWCSVIQTIDDGSS